MPYTLDQVVPWGRSYEEYVAMFALSEGDLRKRMLGCGDGPASFNAGVARRGGTVVSVDPLYAFSAEEIGRRIRETRAQVIEQARRNMDEFVWTTIPSVEALRALRMTAMRAFLQDFPGGRREGRYLAAALPRLPFRDEAFELALCSHYLFLYSAHVSLEDHLAAIREMCRVAGEARIFPLLELGARPSRHLEGVLAALTAEGYAAEVRGVDYEFQRGGHEMMVVRGDA